MDYWCVTVPNRPGEGLRIFESLRTAGVDILSFTSFPITNNQAQFAVVPDARHSQELARAVGSAGLTLSERKQAIFIQGKSRIGAMAEILKKLAAAKVNVHAANAAVAPEGGFGLIVWTRTERELGDAMTALNEGWNVDPWPSVD